MVLWSAAIVLVLVAFLHSYLGEIRILSPLLNAPPQGVLRSARVRGILRGAWHATSLAWVVVAIIVLLTAGTSSETGVVSAVLALSVLTAAGCLVSWGPAHPGFIAFAVCAILLAVQRFA